MTPFLILLAILALPAVAHAGDPTLVWRTLETKHFRISYNTRETRLAQRLAVVAEHAHEVLAPVLGHEPAYKTDIAIIDFSDDANGFTYSLPYNHVTLYAVPPDDRSELNDYDDWLGELIMHEYTHVTHLDTIGGPARWLNWVLGWGERGHLAVPNAAQPRFVLEGLAVLEESKRTSAGRLRSSIYEMWLRCAALQQKFMRLDQVTNAPIQFPRGAAAYLYGSAFMAWIDARYGDGALLAYSHEYGSNWVPGAMNRALRRVTGRTFEELYPSFVADKRRQYQAEAARVVDAGATPTRVLTEPREYAGRPVITLDGKWAIWSDSDSWSRPGMRRIAVDTDGAAPGLLPPGRRVIPDNAFYVDGSGDAALAPDGKTLYYGALDVWRSNYVWGDLYATDLATLATRRLTHGLRAGEPSVSPDGKTLVFALFDEGSRSLATMPVEGGEVTRIVSNRDDLTDAYTPAWSPDGKTIAFSWWREGGYRDIWLYDVATGHLRPLMRDRAIDLDPRWSPDGKYLYFSSDRSGIYDVYAWEAATGALWQVTNLVGGAFAFTPSPDGKKAVFVGFEADGYRIEAMDLDEKSFRPAPPFVDDRPPSDVPPGFAELPSRPYQAWRTLWPHTIVPQSYPDAFGQVLALHVAGSDAVGLHDFALTVGQGLGRANDLSVDLTYDYYSTYPTLTVDASRAVALRGGLFTGGEPQSYVEDDYSILVGASFPIVQHIASLSTVSVDYNLAWLHPIQGFGIPLDPIAATPRLPETGVFSSLGLSWAYSNVRRYTYSSFGAEGRSLSLDLGLSLRALGSRENVESVSWHWSEYIPVRWKFLAPLYRDHVLWVRWSGAVSVGDILRRGVYYLGGWSAQPDLISTFYNFARPAGGSLRGYGFDSLFGDQFHLVNMEYRFPIWWIEHGAGTTPIYLKNLHGALFTDVGNAFYGPFDASQLKVGVGAELRLEVLLAWSIRMSFQVGYAHGLMTGGQDQFYVLLNNPF